MPLVAIPFEILSGGGYPQYPDKCQDFIDYSINTNSVD